MKEHARDQRPDSAGSSGIEGAKIDHPLKVATPKPRNHENQGKGSHIYRHQSRSDHWLAAEGSIGSQGNQHSESVGGVGLRGESTSRFLCPVDAVHGSAYDAMPYPVGSSERFQGPCFNGRFTTPGSLPS